MNALVIIKVMTLVLIKRVFNIERTLQTLTNSKAHLLRN